MGDFISDVGRKLLAIVVLIVAAYILFKIVGGFLAAVAGIVIVVLALMAVFWAVGTLRSSS
jgi:hypothetical protein